MRIGIFGKTFSRPTIESVLDAVRDHGLGCIQLNLISAGLDPMPARIDPGLARRVRTAAAERRVEVAAVSGTFNMIHPDLAVRTNGLDRLAVLARAARELGTSVITLCTGTRDRENMWRAHPDNGRPEAWRDLLATMEPALRIAEDSDVTLAFEPEVSNVIDSALKGRRLLDELRSPRLKVIMDGANLFHAGELPRMSEILDAAFDLLGGDIVIAHAKDLSRDGEAGHEPAGLGLLDYDRYIGRLRSCGFDGPLILHSLSEAQVAGCVAFLRQKLAAARA